MSSSSTHLDVEQVLDLVSTHPPVHPITTGE